MNSVVARATKMDLLSKLIFQGYHSDFGAPRADLKHLQAEFDQIFAMSA